MLSRREFIQVAMATAATCGLGYGMLGSAAARQKINQNELLKFDSKGQVTLLHFTDCHAQIVPVFFREPSVNIGVGEVAGLPPHITGDEFIKRFKLEQGSLDAYMLSHNDFASLASEYGRVGGMDRMASLVKAIRDERPNNTLLLDGGDTWQGSYSSLKTGGEDMVKVMNQLGVDAMTAHWEFTFGDERVNELIEKMNFPFLCNNVFDTTWDEPVFDGIKYFERGGVNIAVIGQAFPYTPVANPRYLMEEWSFGIREDVVREKVEEAREAGAELVVLLSHNGFDVDRKLASRVDGIDVILTGHTHDALPVAINVNDTLLIASGSHGKYLSRLDIEVENKKIKDYSYKLIPVLSDAIDPDPEMAKLITDIRSPYIDEVSRVLGKAESTLYRRGNFNGSFDDLICDAILQERDVQISLSPGFRWGASVVAGQDIIAEDVYNMTAITYPNCYKTEMSGAFIKEILEDVADNIFNEDPYFQQGGDMVRVGGMSYNIDPYKKIGERITEMRLIGSGELIEGNKNYSVGGWASVNPEVEGPPIYDLVNSYIEGKKVINMDRKSNVKVMAKL